MIHYCYFMYEVVSVGLTGIAGHTSLFAVTMLISTIHRQGADIAHMMAPIVLGYEAYPSPSVC